MPGQFAASPIVTKEEIARVAAEAVAVAKANSALQKRPVQLAPTKAYVDKWTTPFTKNPFEVAVTEKLALLEKANNEVKSVPKVFAAGDLRRGLVTMCAAGGMAPAIIIERL